MIQRRPKLHRLLVLAKKIISSNLLVLNRANRCRPPSASLQNQNALTLVARFQSARERKPRHRSTEAGTDDNNFTALFRCSWLIGSTHRLLFETRDN